MYTTWVTNWLDPDHAARSGHPVPLVLPGLVLSASVPDAFETRGLAFAVVYAAIQGGRTLFILWALRRDCPVQPATSRHPVLAGVLGRALARRRVCARCDCGSRLWGAAPVPGVPGASVGFWTPGLGRSTTTDWDVEGGHMAERCGLFIIIALGESLLVTGATFWQATWTTDNVASAWPRS